MVAGSYSFSCFALSSFQQRRQRFSSSWIGRNKWSYTILSVEFFISLYSRQISINCSFGVPLMKNGKCVEIVLELMNGMNDGKITREKGTAAKYFGNEKLIHLISSFSDFEMT